MRFALFVFAAAIQSVFVTNTYCYELATHAAITQNSYDMSLELSSTTSDLFSIFGIIVADPNDAFGNKYYDVFGPDIYERNNFPHENNIITAKTINEQPQSIKGWLMRGAIREDDVVADSVANGPCNINDDKNPQDDPYPDPPSRPINHFYDPVNNRGLNQIVVNGDKATDWALGVYDALVETPVEDASRRNHFTLLDAREVQYRALI